MLNATQVRTIRPNGKVQNFTDGGGLYLRVTAAGKMTWRLEYSLQGKRQSTTLGEYPAMSLAEARIRQGEIKSNAKQGIRHAPEPSFAALPAKAEPEPSPTFGEYVRFYLASLRKTNPAEQTLQKNVWLLETLAAPLHDKPIAAIRARDILPVIEAVAYSGRRESAVRLRSRIGAVFDFAIVRDEAEINPVHSLKKVLPKVEVESTAAITDEQAFGKLLLALDGYPDPGVSTTEQFQATGAE